MNTFHGNVITKTPKRLKIPGDFPSGWELFYELMIVLNKVAHIPERIYKEMATHYPHKAERL